MDQIHLKKLRLAMALRSGTRKQYAVEAIQRRHFDATARACGLGGGMGSVIDDVVARTPAVSEEVGGRPPTGFPEEVFEGVIGGLRRAAKQMGTKTAE